MHPAARQTCQRLATRSRPERPVMKDSDRCPAYSHTVTAYVSRSCARGPSPAPPQIAQAGALPSGSRL